MNKDARLAQLKPDAVDRVAQLPRQTSFTVPVASAGSCTFLLWAPVIIRMYTDLMNRYRGRQHAKAQQWRPTTSRHELEQSGPIMIIKFGHDLPEPPNKRLGGVVAPPIMRVALPVCYVYRDVGTAHQNL